MQLIEWLIQLTYYKLRPLIHAYQLSREYWSKKIKNYTELLDTKEKETFQRQSQLILAPREQYDIKEETWKTTQATSRPNYNSRKPKKAKETDLSKNGFNYIFHHSIHYFFRDASCLLVDTKINRNLTDFCWKFDFIYYLKI